MQNARTAGASAVPVNLGFAILVILSYTRASPVTAGNHGPVLDDIPAGGVSL